MKEHPERSPAYESRRLYSLPFCLIMMPPVALTESKHQINHRDHGGSSCQISTHTHTQHREWVCTGDTPMGRSGLGSRTPIKMVTSTAKQEGVSLCKRPGSALSILQYISRGDQKFLSYTSSSDFQPQRRAHM